MSDKKNKHVTHLRAPDARRSSTGWTRRQFLSRVGEAGGAAAVYESMAALGLVAIPPAWSGPPTLQAGQGEGRSVLILGAGIGGLTTAFILSKYGYRCHILEATARAGGRNHTARRGTVITEESTEHGTTRQECIFDQGLYLNLGPGRLPYHHRRVLGYCRELGVGLEPYVMNTTGNLVQKAGSFGGTAQPYRRIANDTRGHIAELLAKAVSQGALDQDLNEGDRDKLLELLRKFGPLGATAGSPADSYAGSTRTGCALDSEYGPTPDVYHNCAVAPPANLGSLLDSEFWNFGFYGPVEYEWQPTLFEPVGGMDMIVAGFVRAVGDLVTYNAPVTEVRLMGDTVAVTYRQGAQEVTEVADYCVSNIPCPVLENIDNNFSDEFMAAIRGTEFHASCKVGWQTNTRFWEDDKYRIYGGISWTDDIIEQIWYPSTQYFTQKGTLTGAYIHDWADPDRQNATVFGRLSLADRLARARAGGAKLHDEFNDNSIVPIELGLSIAWQNIPYQLGAWPGWGDDTNDDRDYQRLLLPDGRFYVVGDQASTLPGWQEGAMMSAEHVVELIAGLKPHVVPEGTTAPNTRRVVQGHG